MSDMTGDFKKAFARRRKGRQIAGEMMEGEAKAKGPKSVPPKMRGRKKNGGKIKAIGKALSM